MNIYKTKIIMFNIFAIFPESVKLNHSLKCNFYNRILYLLLVLLLLLFSLPIVSLVVVVIVGIVSFCGLI